jgi:hypothetical protein
MRAEQIGNGTMIDGRRVVAMTTGPVNGRRAVTVRFATETRNRRGKVRKGLSEPVTYFYGTEVSGTRKATTWAMPAGPVGRKPGGKLHGGWWGDGDDNSSQGRADRHSRMISSLTYA